MNHEGTFEKNKKIKTSKNNDKHFKKIIKNLLKEKSKKKLLISAPP